MDSRAMQSHAHNHDEHHHHDPHNVGSQQVAHGHGVEEHHDDHEKKSVLKKVKAKAKKIKDTITKHGHHDHEHGHEYHYEDQHIPDDHDMDEEDDAEEEMVQDPEVHGAPIYDSAAVRNATPGQVQTTGRPKVNYGGTTLMGEEPHHEPKVVVVSPVTEINQSRSTDPTRTFVGGEKTMQSKVNLERPMGLEEDPHAPGSRPQAHAPANYQTKVTDPTGTGGAEIDITPVQNSLARMNVHNEPKPSPALKILPTVTETQYPSVGSHHQFVPELSTATKTHYPSTQSHDQNLPQISSEIKTQYPKSYDQSMPLPTQYPYPSAEIHDQNIPQISSATKTQYPTHDHSMPLSTSTKTQYPYPSATSHDQNLSQLPSSTKPHYPSAGSHDHSMPLHTSTKSQYPYPSATSHDQNLSGLPSATQTQYPSATNHNQNLSDLSSATRTQYPSAGSHDQFTPEFSTRTTTTGENNTVEEQPQTQTYQESMEKPSNQTSYTDKISSATSAIADKAITAKNTVASKLGYGEKGDVREENQTSSEKPSNQSSYTEKISSATSAIADKAASAKNTVASKLGYGEKGDVREENQTSDEKQSNQSSYTEKISSATSAISDKAASAKNTIASKLGFGEKDDEEKKVTTHEENKSENTSATSGSPTGYGKKVAVSLTEKLAPVYEKVSGVGSAVKSKVPGTGTGSGVVEQDKGVSMKDYFAEKLRPGDEDRALSEVISETLYKKGEEPVEEEVDRDVKKVVTDAVHKRGEEVDKRRAQHRPLGKVTESEEVKRRLGTGDEETEKRYEESYVNSPGKGVVDKLKGVVGSWFGTSQEGEDMSRNTTRVEVEQVNQAAGERRLQDSAN